MLVISWQPHNQVVLIYQQNTRETDVLLKLLQINII